MKKVPEDQAKKIMGDNPINPRIVVHIHGGLVDSVISEGPMEVLIIDEDTEGADDDEISVIDGEEVCCHIQNTVVDKELIRNSFKNYYDSF